MKLFSKIEIGLLVVGSGLFCLIACKKEPKSKGIAVPEIAVSLPIIRSVVLHKSYPGYLTSQQTVNLVGRVNGYLEQMLYTPGQRVKKGELLFVIEPTPYRDNVIQSEAALDKAQAALDYAQSNYMRMQEAAQSNAVSEIELVQAQSNVKQGIAAVEAARSSLAQARTDLSYCYIRAPFDGHISRNQLDVGSYISGAASPVTLATLYQDDQLYAYFNIEESQFVSMHYTDSLINNSQDKRIPVQIFFPEAATDGLWGELDYVSPDVTLSTGTLNLRATVKNSSGSLKSGLYVTVNFPYKRDDHALLIRDASIGTDQLGKYIYVVNDSNRVAYRSVETGELIDDTLRIISKGIQPGERYVTTALLKVRSGMMIKPITQ